MTPVSQATHSPTALGNLWKVKTSNNYQLEKELKMWCSVGEGKHKN